MMYLKIENENGTISFAPMKSNNIYVLCKDCGSMVPVNNAEEIDWGEVPFEDIDLCAECSARRDAIEEEYLAQERSRRIIEIVRTVKEQKRIAAEEGRTLGEDEFKSIVDMAAREVVANSLSKCK
jgi:hypothetical protein